ncbi:Hypothetical protein AT6N2_L0721 [Agrobacterium tumefaciens]|nr:Hypothetical protein AT6N2_L0721 [Agrobacterium tumefaciens]
MLLHPVQRANRRVGDLLDHLGIGIDIFLCRVEDRRWIDAAIDVLRALIAAGIDEDLAKSALHNDGRGRVVVDEQINLALLQCRHGRSARADTDDGDIVVAEIVLLHVVANEEVRRRTGRSDAHFLALDRFRLGRVEIGVVLTGENQTGIARQLHEANNVLVLRLHLDRMVIEPDGDVGGAGHECLKHLGAALGEVLGGDIQPLFLVEAEARRHRERQVIEVIGTYAHPDGFGIGRCCQRTERCCCKQKFTHEGLLPVSCFVSIWLYLSCVFNCSDGFGKGKAFKKSAGGSDEASRYCAIAHFQLNIEPAGRMFDTDECGHGQSSSHIIGNRPWRHRGGRDADSACRRKRGMAIIRHEISDRKRAAFARRRDQHRLWNHHVRHVAHAHQLTGFDTNAAHPLDKIAVVGKCLWLLITGDAKIGGAHKHHRNGAIDCRHRHAVDHVDSIARRQQLTGFRTGSIHEGQRDRRGKPRYAIDRSVTEINHLAAARRDFRLDQLTGVHVVNAHQRVVALGLDKSRLDCEGADSCQHVSAIWRVIDILPIGANLRKKIINIGAFDRGGTDDGHFRRYRISTANAVDLQGVA